MVKWVKVCRASDVRAGDMRGFVHDGMRILLVNFEGTLYAVEGTCTHEDADLSTGFLMENRVTCPLHLSQFDIVSGEALAPPATEPLRKFKVKIEGSDVFVEVD